MNKILNLYNKYEYPIFIFIALVTSAQVFLYWAFPTLDGPHHLHNSNVILGMLEGNEILHQYYNIHPIPVSNLVGHGLLSLFNFVLPSNIALNLLIYIYMIGMAFGFRYLIISLSGRFSPMGYAIFPFIPNATLVLGLFNFCLGIVLFFFVLGFWFRIYKKLNTSRLIVLGGILLIMIFTHLLSFVLFGLSLVVFLVYEFVFNLFQTGKLDIKRRFFLVLKLAVIAIPPLVILYFYQQTIGDLATKNFDRVVEDNVSLWQNFYFVRPLIIFLVHEDGMANLPIFIGFVVIVATYIGLKVFRKATPDGNIFNRGFVLIMTLLFALFICITPPGFMLHTMLLRLTLIFYLFLILWLSAIRFPSWMEMLCAVFFLAVFAEHQFRMGPTRSRLSVDAHDMYKITEYMEPNSVFLPINGGSIWINEFVMNYIGSEKQMVNVLNPQAYGPFPIVWDYDNMPYTSFGGHAENEIGYSYRTGPPGRTEQEIDYVVIYRNRLHDKRRQDEKYASFFAILDTEFELVAETPRKKATLYRRK